MTIKNGPAIKPIGIVGTLIATASYGDPCGSYNSARPHIVNNNPRAIFTTLTIVKNGNSSTPNFNITAGAY